MIMIMMMVMVMSTFVDSINFNALPQPQIRKLQKSRKSEPDKDVVQTQQGNSVT